MLVGPTICNVCSVVLHGVPRSRVSRLTRLRQCTCTCAEPPRRRKAREEDLPDSGERASDHHLRDEEPRWDPWRGAGRFRGTAARAIGRQAGPGPAAHTASTTRLLRAGWYGSARAVGKPPRAPRFYCTSGACAIVIVPAKASSACPTTLQNTAHSRPCTVHPCALRRVSAETRH